MEQREREVSLRDYIEIIIKRKAVVILSVVVVLVASILFVPSKPVVYRASAFIIIEGSPYNTELLESIQRFAKTHALAEEVIRYMEFEKTKALRMGGDLAGAELSDITPEGILNSVVVEQEKGTDILVISALSASPRKAMEIANITAQVVVEQSLKGMTGGAQASIRYMERQMEAVKRKMEETKSNLPGYTKYEDAGVSSAEARELEKLQQDYINAKLSRQMAEAKFKVLEERVASRESDEDILAIVPQSKELIKLKDKLVFFQRQLSALLVQFTEEHPKVIEARMTLENINKEIEKEALKPLEDLQAQILEYKNAEETAKGVLETRFPVVSNQEPGEPDSDSRVLQLTRELSLDEKTYNKLAEEREKLRLDTVLNATRVRILRLASEPKKPEKTQGVPAAVVAISLGLILGITAAFIQENVDTSLKTLEDIEYYLHKPITGVIPFIRSDGKKSRHVYRGR
ncbi:MAG: GNVR domain-containing protein [Candidatus Omnitrophica bacterium]|nr:GNVR domain-containing protein [Candidatus Omnitrophota bacterium]MDD5429298.1 GNVR domain-containing protein [Candidatus Omnitrophota bacterium]